MERLAAITIIMAAVIDTALLLYFIFIDMCLSSGAMLFISLLMTLYIISITRETTGDGDDKI